MTYRREGPRCRGPSSTAGRCLVALVIAAFVAAGCGADEPVVGTRTFAGLENVDRALHALGSVWVVTSSLDDNFSIGAADAAILRLDPSSGQSAVVVDGLVTQPDLVALDNRVWAKLDDRLAAFGADGEETTSIPWDADGELLAGSEHLWATDLHSGSVHVLDPTTGAALAVHDVGRFPIGPIVAFGHAWFPSATDGTVAIIDEATVGDATHRSVALPHQFLTHATAVPGGAAGDEVWVLTLDGEVVVVSAQRETLGSVRKISFDRPINEVHPAGERVVLLPVSGLDVVVADIGTGATLGTVRLRAIPFRAVVRGEDLFVAGDGTAELLAHIDLAEVALVAQYEIGRGTSTTTGPTQPIVVDDEIWITNRGDDTIFVVSAP